MRLILSRPRPDETISSIIDRACSLYRISRFDLIEQLCPSFRNLAGSHDFDVHPPAELIKNLAAALDMRVEEIEALKLKASPWRLGDGKRDAFCPKCLEDDVAAKRDPYFRAEWTWMFMTHCSVHGCPLECWQGEVKFAGQKQWPRMMMVHGDLVSSDVIGRDIVLPCRSFNRLSQDYDEVYKLWSDITRFERWILNNQTILYKSGSIRGRRLRRLYCFMVARWAVIPPRSRRAVSLVNKLVTSSDAQLIFDESPSWHETKFCEIWSFCRREPHPDVRREWIWMLSQLVNAVSNAGLLKFPKVSGIKDQDWMKILV